MSALSATSWLLAGDLAVSSLRSIGYAIHLAPDRKRLRTLVVDKPGGRIMSKELGAGFYSNGLGCLSWAWGGEILDQYDLWELRCTTGAVLGGIGCCGPQGRRHRRRRDRAAANAPQTGLEVAAEAVPGVAARPVRRSLVALYQAGAAVTARGEAS